MMKHEIQDEHLNLAHQFGARAYAKEKREREKARDKAVSTLYYAYGVVDTQRLTKWSRPTILACVERASKRR